MGKNGVFENFTFCLENIWMRSMSRIENYPKRSATLTAGKS